MPERGVPADLLNVMGDLADFDSELEAQLERGKTERAQILEGTERPGEDRQPYARTLVDIDFEREEDLREAVRLLRWSDERLRARPDWAILWDWKASFRQGMRISFGVNWYDREFFERRRNAFKEPSHVKFYAMFGATPDSLKMREEILGADPATSD